jgi:long-chain acyl-CoA synthetase
MPYRLRDEPLPAGLARKHRIADRLVYSKVKEKLGGRLRVAISGGAPLAPEIAEFFLTLDILILEGYGLSECTTACAVNLPGRVKFGTVGRILPGFEVKTAEDGEILIRSETVFAGYYSDEEATRAAIDSEGWLHSGDIGEIDDDGFLRITDRKKDIIVTAGGKNLAPQALENALKSSNLVSQALVVGDRRPYVVALVALDEDEADGVSPEDARAAVQRAVDDVNRNRSRFEQIKRFAIVPRDFSAEEGEVTPTMKLKRKVVEQHFADEIERLYAA